MIAVMTKVRMKRLGGGGGRGGREGGRWDDEYETEKTYDNTYQGNDSDDGYDSIIMMTDMAIGGNDEDMEMKRHIEVHFTLNQRAKENQPRGRIKGQSILICSVWLTLKKKRLKALKICTISFVLS